MRVGFLILIFVCVILSGCAQGDKRDETLRKESVDWEEKEPEAGDRKESADAGSEGADFDGKESADAESEGADFDGKESADFGSEGTDFDIKEMELLAYEDPENENLADMLQRAGSGMMVQIGAGSRLGSGVIYGLEEGCLLVLTAAHVLEEAQQSLRVTFADGLSVACTNFACLETGDLGVIRVPGFDISEENESRYLRANVDRESFDGMKSGDGCIVMGSRAGVAAEAYEGKVLDCWIYMEDYGSYMMWVKAEGRSGMSGGGLFDGRGHFLGILSGGNEDGELAVTPLSLIQAALESQN